MVKFLGPKYKKIRTLGFIRGIFSNQKKFKNKTPGEHGTIRTQKGLRSYISEDYKEMIFAHQRIKYMHGINSNQFKKALKVSKKFNSSIFQYLKSRLDFKVFNLGFCKSIREARFLVNHNKVLVNGFKVSKPGYISSNLDHIFVKK